MTQSEALDILKLGNNVFLTGSAGTGKTYVLNQYIQYLKNNNISVAVTASTGIAASHMNGQTVHSWSGLGIRSSLSPYDLEAMESKRYLWDRFQNVKVLIIDEISMLDHIRLDMVDAVLRFFKRNNESFGGIQVVVCGDFFQLPPVNKGGEQKAYFAYESRAWEDLKIKTCYLTKSYRQNDDAFLSVLNAIRENNMSPEILQHLHFRLNKELEGLDVRPTKLYTHNADVDAINQKELEATEGLSQTYHVTEKGNDVLSSILKNNCLAPAALKLKKGAQVMFVKNNYDMGYVNGTLGTVIEIKREYPVVKTLQGAIIRALPEEWNVEEDGKSKASIKQVPLRLAWAITVHKSQGMTLDTAEIDLSKSFEKGMGYVALSRLKSLSGLKLIGFNAQALEVSEEVLMFDEDSKRFSEEAQEYLKKYSESEKLEKQKEFIKKQSKKTTKSTRTGQNIIDY